MQIKDMKRGDRFYIQVEVCEVDITEDMCDIVIIGETDEYVFQREENVPQELLDQAIIKPLTRAEINREIGSRIKVLNEQIQALKAQRTLIQKELL